MATENNILRLVPNGPGRLALRLENPDAWPYYPDVVVQLTGTDGNAFAVIGAVEKALRAAVGGGAADDFRDEATKGDYDELLRTVMRWVEVR